MIALLGEWYAPWLGIALMAGGLIAIGWIMERAGR